MADDPLQREYYALLDTVGDFDQRLLTVKGWGVTLSLAAISWGFEHEHYGMFLVAALSGLAFWLIEWAFKRHQMRYYLRMREIEVLEFGRAQKGSEAFSSPRIDWSWNAAAAVYAGKPVPAGPVFDAGRRDSYRNAWGFGHVMLPHVISVLAGVLLWVAAHTHSYGFGDSWKW